MISVTQAIGGILVRELVSVKKEIEGYEREEDLWRTPPGISNSTGTLALHLAGNLQHFIGAVLGRTGYVRDRDAEFARRGVPRAELLRELDATIAVVEQTFAGLDDSVLAGEFPVPIGPTQVQTGDWLIHLASHLGYHLGQIDYHRRLVNGDPKTVGTVAPPRLRSARPVA